MPFSLGKRIERGDDKQKLMIHVVRRGLILIVLGIIYNNGLFQINYRNLLLRFRLREPNNSPNDHYDKQKSQHTLALNWQKRLAL